MADPGSSEGNINPEHEHLLYELETSDASGVGFVLRTIYDGDEHQKFMERLDARIKSHDRDIERMCNFHYQGFIESIRELLQVRNQAQKLKNEIMQSDVTLQESAAKLLKRGEELAQLRTVQSNIAAAIDSLSQCLPVLQMYSTLQKQMKEKRYYSALKTLEQLEHSYLPRIPDYRFSQQMRTDISCLRQNIKVVSLSDLKDFLETIWIESPKIGKISMRQAMEQNNLDYSLLSLFLDNQPRDGEQSTTERQETSVQDFVNFSPVFRCLHIHSVLGAREAFERDYRKQRKEQASLALQPPYNMKLSIEGYRDYFCGIVGFFAVEEHVLNAADKLVTRSYLNEVWEMAVSKINNSIRTEAAYCKDDDFMLKIRNIIILFSQTVQGYGYPVQRLAELYPEIQNQHTEILMQKWSLIFKDICNQDNYFPIMVENEDEYRRVVALFPYKDEELEKSPYPRKFPFSYFVPKMYQQIQEYCVACFKFLEDLNMNSTEIDDILRKATNLLVIVTLSRCLSSWIKDKKIGLSQLIQILINTNYLEDSCSHLEGFISNLAGTSDDGLHVAVLQGRQMFKKIRGEVEAQIDEQLQFKISGFLDLANYDWLLSETKDMKASDYIVDLIAFLKNTFFSISNAPGKIVQTACMTACMHISQQLMRFLTNDKIVKQISRGALQQLNLDVLECEKFAGLEGDKGFEEGTMRMYFADLRQLLDLFLNSDWSIYFHDYGSQSSKYVRVTPDAAITLLEKVREGDKRTVWSALRRTDKEKKKHMEDISKRLRLLLANGTAT